MKSEFVALEGIDKSGKTSLAIALVTFFHKKGIQAIRFEEPSNNPIGKLFRELSKNRNLSPFVAALLSTAARHYQQQEISHALHDSHLVITDRSYLSGLAYHYRDGIPFEQYASLNQDVVKPSLYIYLNVPLALSINRADIKSRDRWEHPDFLSQMHKCYNKAMTYIRKHENANIIEIDVTKPIEIVTQKVSSLIENHISGKSIQGG